MRMSSLVITVRDLALLLRNSFIVDNFSSSATNPNDELTVLISN